MKHWYLIPLAAIAGLIAGSWGPRADLAKLKASGSGIGQRAERRDPSGGFGAIADFAHVPQRASRSRVVQVVKQDSDEESADTTNAVATAETESTNAVARTERVSPEDLRARIDEAAELWRTRVELARTQWKARLELDEEGGRQFDEAVERMNDALRETMAEAAERIAKDGKLTNELGIRLIGDATAELADAYDDIGNLVPDDKRGDVAAMTLHDFIDPSVIEPMVAVQGLLTDGEGDEGP